MRRISRLKKDGSKTLNDKIILYSGIGVAVLAVIVLGLLMYSKKLSSDVQNSTLSLEQMANIAGDNNDETESASTEIGKNIEEVQNESNENKVENNVNNTSTGNNIVEKRMNVTNTINTNTVNKANNSTNKLNTTNTNKTAVNNNTTNSNDTKKEPVKELTFQKPVEGDIVREYAKENLVYSETLKEWVTHTGIDIKADKTTVVKASEAGTIKSIKNDPRYGLTIVIEHDNNFQTVYSNLLTSEFVVEGEKVEKGQSIGTVGNTAVFEVVDEPHLHFEILKDSLAVDPSIYIK